MHKTMTYVMFKSIKDLTFFQNLKCKHLNSTLPDYTNLTILWSSACLPLVLKLPLIFLENNTWSREIEGMHDSCIKSWIYWQAWKWSPGPDGASMQKSIYFYLWIILHVRHFLACKLPQKTPINRGGGLNRLPLIFPLVVEHKIRTFARALVWKTSALVNV